MTKQAQETTPAIHISPMAAARRRIEALMSDRGIYGQLERAKASIAARLPDGCNVDRWIASIHTEIMKTPKLADCDPSTVLGGAYEIAQMGLVMGSALGQAYLVPFGRQAQLIIGYKGMIAMSQDAGIVDSVSAAVVYEKDTFRYAEGTGRELVHRPSMDRDRGEPVCVYAVLYLTNGGHHVAVLPWWEIEDLRDKQARRSRKPTPWTTHTDEMAKKTAIRRAMKYVRLTPKPARAVQLDEMADSGIDQRLDLSAGPVLEEIHQIAEQTDGEALDVEASHPFDPDFDPTIESEGDR